MAWKKRFLLGWMPVLTSIGMHSGSWGAEPDEPVVPKTLAITTTNGAIVTIDLVCWPGSGYSWQLANPRARTNLEFIKETFQNGRNEMDGGSGTQHFQFKATGIGKSDLRFIYVRPYRRPFPLDAKATNFVVTVK